MKVERGVVEPVQYGLKLLFGRGGAVSGDDTVAARDIGAYVRRNGQYFACFSGFGSAV